jgi:ribosomal protein S17E
MNAENICKLIKMSNLLLNLSNIVQDRQINKISKYCITISKNLLINQLIKEVEISNITANNYNIISVGLERVLKINCINDQETISLNKRIKDEFFTLIDLLEELNAQYEHYDAELYDSVLSGVNILKELAPSECTIDDFLANIIPKIGMAKFVEKLCANKASKSPSFSMKMEVVYEDADEQKQNEDKNSLSLEKYAVNYRKAEVEKIRNSIAGYLFNKYKVNNQLLSPMIITDLMDEKKDIEQRKRSSDSGESELKKKEDSKSDFWY